jgi:hypothetical protein
MFDSKLNKKPRESICTGIVYFDDTFGPFIKLSVGVWRVLM